MRRGDLLEIEYTREDVLERTRTIHGKVLESSEHVKRGNYDSISIGDLHLMFGMYDELFFGKYFEKVHEGKVGFRLSKRMTRSAGKLQWNTVSGDAVISLGTTLLFQSFTNQSREITVNGIVCHDRLEATMRVLEHELIHLVEEVVVGSSSCSGPLFRRLALNIFGHTDVRHGLVTGYEIARDTFDLQVGDRCSFEHGGERYTGIIHRITKRATVFVEQEGGNYVGSGGTRYVKFYVPLAGLERVDDT